MSMELGFHKIFYVPTIAMKLGQAWPYMPKDKNWAMRFFTLHGIFLLGFILVNYNIFYVTLKNNDLSQTCKNGVLYVVFVVITFQDCILFWRQNQVIDIVEDIQKDYDESKNLTEREREMMQRYVDQGKRVCTLWGILTGGGASLFLVKNIVLTIHYYLQHDPQLVPYYELEYPQFMKEYEDNIFMFIFTYLLMMFYDYYGAMMYAAFVPLGPIFILHACGQLELIKFKIDDLFLENDKEEIRNKLKRIIVHLQYVYSLVERIKDVFKIAYELTLKATAIILPVTVYAMLEAFNQGEISLEFITFVVGGVLIGGSPCYYSDLLMEKGESVRMALYLCGWEREYDHRLRTTLQLLLQNANRPIALQTVFRILNLDALTDLFQQSYAIFNLMNAMWN